MRWSRWDTISIRRNEPGESSRERERQWLVADITAESTVFIIAAAIRAVRKSLCSWSGPSVERWRRRFTSTRSPYRQRPWARSRRLRTDSQRCDHEQKEENRDCWRRSWRDCLLFLPQEAKPRSVGERSVWERNATRLAL